MVGTSTAGSWREEKECTIELLQKIVLNGQNGVRLQKTGRAKTNTLGKYDSSVSQQVKKLQRIPYR